jgi:hypothetical protein
MAGAPEALRRLADHLEEQEHLEAQLVKAKEKYNPGDGKRSDKDKDDLHSVKVALREHRQKGREEGLTLASLGELIGGNEGSVNVQPQPATAKAGVKPAGSKED